MAILKLPDIYRSLSQFGIKKAQVRALLPDWWDDASATSELGTWEFVMLVARRLSVDANALSQGDVMPIGSVSSIAFKHRRTKSSNDYLPSSMIAASLSEAISAASLPPFRGFDNHPSAIRDHVRNSNPEGIVDFDGLLTFCWKQGVPVIPLPNLPVGLRKMDGAIFHLKDRPAIIISRKNDSRSWLNFILAHELGHLCLGHLKPGASIIDADLKGEVETQTESPHDRQEREADQFALDLLGGDEAEQMISSWDHRMPGANIAAQALSDFQATGSSAGHLVLRHAFRTKRWAEAQIALKFLAEDMEAQKHLVGVLKENIDLNLIADDLQDLVASITGLENV